MENKLCRVRLRTICLIVAWIHIAFAIFAIVISLLIVYAYNVVKLSDVEEDSQIGIPIFSLYLGLNVVRLAIAGMLVKGILRNRRRLLAPFVYGQCMIITFCVGFIVTDIWFKLMHKKGSYDYTLLDFLLDGIHVGLTILLLYPVYIYYRKMGFNLDHPELHELDSSALANTEKKCITTDEV